jgi:uncharacterized protein (TIGR02145 family)
MIDGYIWPSNNDTIEKYCHSDLIENCNKYGGLYQWKEMMNYTNQEGSQGICPPGWRIPTDEDWKLLEGIADSQYGIGDPEWDIYWQNRGYDAATNLKTTSGWWENGNGTDMLGFAAMPGGDRFGNGYYYLVGGYGLWWTSTQRTSKRSWYRLIYYYYPDVYRNGDFSKDAGLSVRCLKDD